MMSLVLLCSASFTREQVSTVKQRILLPRVLCCLFCALLCGPNPSLGKPTPWTQAKTTSAGPAVSLGGYAGGCLQGGDSLPERGEGYQSIRRHRHRFYAHPKTIQVVIELGKAAKAAQLKSFDVGDLSQPRGGRMSSGHRSHQSGLDVDIWFGGDPEYVKGEGQHRLKKAKRIKNKSKRIEAIFNAEHPSMITGPQEKIDVKVWSERQAKLLELAAQREEVARIFVHFRIKEAMCARYRATPEAREEPAPLWLRKLRPWYGHDQHFHIRLHCPEDSPHCEPQGPLPDGPGCEGLSWFSHAENRKRMTEAKKLEQEEAARVSAMSPADQSRHQREKEKIQREKWTKARERSAHLAALCAHLIER